MNIFNSLLKLMLSFFVIILALLVLLVVGQRGKPGIGQGGGYRLIYDRTDHVHIIKGTKIVVTPTIVDSQKEIKWGQSKINP